MYIDKVRKAIRELDRVEYDAYLMRLHRILKEQYKKNLKPSVLRMRVDEFMNGKNSSIEYFEAYLMAFDEMVPEGAIKILQDLELEMENPWRPLMQRLMKNNLLSQESIEHLKTAQVNEEMETVLNNVIAYCSASHPKVFVENLHLFNQFISMKKG